MKFKLFGRVIEIKGANHSAPKLNDDAGWSAYLSGGSAAITGDTAIKVAAVFRCVDLLAKTMASLPLHMFKATPGGKERAKKHPLYNLLLVLPNEYTTAYEFWQCFVVNLLLSEGAYARILRGPNGNVQSLWNIPTRNVVFHGTNEKTGERYIQITDADGKTATLYPGEFMYVPNFLYSSDFSSENPMTIAAEVLGITRSLNQYAHATFEQGVNPGGTLECPSGLSEEAYNRLLKDFYQKYSGAQNQGKWMILEEGLTAKPITRDLEKTQALESRKFAVTEVCRIFGVPPHLCFDLEHATFSNIEQQSLEFVRDAINPLSVRIEQALYRDVLTPRERKDYFFKFNTNGLMRGDTAARTAYYNMMRQNGIMNADEIRELEDMNNQADGTGKVYLVNGNMISVEAAKQNMPKGARQENPVAQKREVKPDG